MNFDDRHACDGGECHGAHAVPADPCELGVGMAAEEVEVRPAGGAGGLLMAVEEIARGGVAGALPAARMADL
jgi:hypothetical protein